MDKFVFRCWNDEKKEFYVFTLAQLIDAIGNEQCGEFMYRIQTIANYDRSDESWEQCTQLKDVNGRAVFEGDIVRLKNDPRPQLVKKSVNHNVSYGHGDSSTYLYDGVMLYDYGNERVKIEIIGNIHEHKELLNEVSKTEI